MHRSTGLLAAVIAAGLIPALVLADRHAESLPLDDVRQDAMEIGEKAEAMTAKAANERDSKNRSMEITMRAVTEKGPADSMGTIKVEASPHGVLFRPDLAGLKPGVHGFHLHENPDCGPLKKDGKTVPGGAAGGHYNPKGGSHNGPYEKGHMGDLPALYATSDGSVTVPVLAPRLKIKDLYGRALIIHEGGDNYSDSPEALGGGGARVACGVIEK
ncbi:superoxide dismutase family protein [Marinobacter sp.]|uniref:superoxide dismutase family protein n=1 Tax=Marinobacter sp. TaxID=50741 RepID=UPI00384C48C7